MLGESIGTFGSDGCPDVGGPAETLGTKAVIDWLNGRAAGFDAAGQPVTADWTTGDVGMTGVSYNGTLANQVATTGVEGLKTIIPVSAISCWYDYYRANGLVVAPHSKTRGTGENEYLGEDTDVLGDFIGGPRMDGRCAATRRFLLDHQDRVTGDWSDFWQARDYLHRARRVRASVFAVHGLNDLNVRTKAFAAWWQRLAAPELPRKLWLHNGGHGGPGGADVQARARTAGSTAGCSASATGSRASRACTSSARTAPTATRPTGPLPARAPRAPAGAAPRPGRATRPRPQAVVRRPRARARHRRAAHHRPRRRQPEPPRLPWPRARPATCA